MAHNLLTVNNATPNVLGDINIVSEYGLAGSICEVTHSASSNNASVGDFAQILYGIYTRQIQETSVFQWVSADGRAIKSNNSYAMGIQLNAVGAFYIELVLKFAATAGESITLQIVDSSNTPVSCKAFYGSQIREFIYPSTLHAVINNQTAGNQYFFRVQAVTGSVGQPTTNLGSSYLKCIKL